MTDYRRIDQATELLFDNTVEKVRGQLDVKRQDTSVGLKLLSKFDSLKEYESLFVHKVTEFKGSSASFIILLVEKHFTIVKQKKNVRVEEQMEEVEPIMIFSISQNAGDALITRKTFGDRIASLLSKPSVRFDEYPAFSKNYFVQASQPDALHQNFPRQLLESLSKIKGMTIEVKGNWGLMRPNKNLSENLVLMLISMGYKMVK